jgi:hypothetical protein
MGLGGLEGTRVGGFIECELLLDRGRELIHRKRGDPHQPVVGPDTHCASRKEDAQEMLVSEHGRGCASVVPVRHVRVWLLREALLESLDGFRVAHDPYTVPVPVLIDHLEVRRSAIGVCLQEILELTRCVIDPVVHHADDRVGGPDQVGPAARLRLTDSLVTDDGSLWGRVGSDLVGASHPAQTDLAHPPAGGVFDLVDPEDVTHLLGQLARPELLHVHGRSGQGLRRIAASDRRGRVRVAMGHGHTQHAHGMVLKEIPDFAIALELVVVGGADPGGRSRIDGDEGAAHWGDRDHEMGDPVEGPFWRGFRGTGFVFERRKITLNAPRVLCDGSAGRDGLRASPPLAFFPV